MSASVIGARERCMKGKREKMKRKDGGRFIGCAAVDVEGLGGTEAVEEGLKLREIDSGK